MSAPGAAGFYSHVKEFLGSDTMGRISTLCLEALGVFVLVYYVVMKMLTGVIGNQMRSPPPGWTDFIKSKLKDDSWSGYVPNRITGVKRGALRRRFVLASVNPSKYSLSKQHLSLSVIPEDRTPEQRDPFFRELLVAAWNDTTRRVIFGFFHPYCNAGGGGEKVLWTAVKATLDVRENNVCAIYTGDEEPGHVILANVAKRFGVHLDAKRVVFIYLKKRSWVDAGSWPRFTLLGQAIGSVVLAWEAISALPPDVFIDTMGYPFAYPLVSGVLHIPVAAYVHFPVISRDMLNKLSVSILKPGQLLKYVYWKMFMFAYTFVGSYLSCAMTNSTWTYNHVKKIWWLGPRNAVHILYPPCTVDDLVQFDIEKPRAARLLVLAQFRPEKRHSLILSEFAELLEKLPPGVEKPTLVFIGSIRLEDDKTRVYELRLQARDLCISDNVEFILEAGYDVVKEELSKCDIGINAMWNEHFGIGVVEYVASGAIPVCHASAGPYLDIVVPVDGKPTGFFFKSESDPNSEENSPAPLPPLNEVLKTAYLTSNEEKAAMRQRGRALVLKKFPDDVFITEWEKYITELSKLEIILRKKRLDANQID